MGDYAKLKPTDSANGDVFLSKKSEIDGIVGTLKKDFEQWQHLLKTTNTRETGEFGRLTTEVRSQLTTVKSLLNDVSRFMQQVVEHRNQHPLIDDYEIQQRRDLIATTRSYLGNCRSTMKSPSTRDKLARDKRELEARSGGGGGFDEGERKNDHMIANYRQQQEMEIGAQDEILDEMAEGLLRLGMIGDTIQVELKEQDIMLNEVDEQMDEAADRLTALTAKVDKILGRSDKKRMGLICVLVLILILLVYFTF